ncbi:uncharacterized protein [Argopecten irradians]|uniref:uncharacterized protein n=1 Tax=Argopecten irradians TaxID=31199 RepID=UPI003715B436
MPNTKVTKRKPGMACPLCFARFGTQEAWETHLIMCGKETREKKQFECPHCDFATARQILLNRHVARRHGPSPKDDTGDDSDWLRTDPGSLPQFTGAVSGTDHESRDLEIGRTFSKPTRPMPVSAPKRCKTNEGGGFLPKESLISLLSPAVLGEKDTFCSSKGSVASVSAPAEPTQDGTRGTVDKCMESQGDRRSISTQTTAQPRRRTNKVTTTKFVDGMQIVSEEITEWDEYVD